MKKILLQKNLFGKTESTIIGAKAPKKDNRQENLFKQVSCPKTAKLTGKIAKQIPIKTSQVKEVQNKLLSKG